VRHFLQLRRSPICCGAYEALDTAFRLARSFVILCRHNFRGGTRKFKIQKAALRDNGMGARIPPGFDVDRIVNYAYGTLDKQRIIDTARACGWSVLADRGDGSLVLG
jgi:hypothetical protein